MEKFHVKIAGIVEAENIRDAVDRAHELLKDRGTVGVMPYRIWKETRTESSILMEVEAD